MPETRVTAWLAEQAQVYRLKLWVGLTHWGIVLAGLLIERAATAVALILVARRVDPVHYGQYFSVFSLVNFLVVLPSYGLDSWLLTQAQSDHSKMRTLWSNLVRSRSGLLLAWTMLVILAGFILPENTFPFALLIPTTIGAAFDSLGLLSISALRCMNRHGAISILQSVSSLALLVFTAGLPGNSMTIVHFAILRAILSALTFLATILMIGRGVLIRLPARLPTSGILRAATPFMWAEFFSTVYIKADVSLIAFMIGSEGNSIYGPAVNLLQVAFLVPRALYSFIVPVLSRTFTEKREAFRQIGWAQLAAQIGGGAVLSLLTFLFASFLIQATFGAAYAHSAQILTLLSPIPFLRSLNSALAALLTSSGNQGIRTRAQAASAIFNVAANLYVIMPFGIPGVAVVYVLSEILLAVGYFGSLLIVNRPRRVNLP